MTTPPPSGSATTQATAGPTRKVLLGLGEASWDEFSELRQWPKRGSKVPARGRHSAPGGQVATALAAAQGLGVATRLVAVVGDDDQGEALEAAMQRSGVEAHLTRISGARTRGAQIFVEADGERTIIEHRDPACRIDPATLDVEGLMTNVAALHLDATQPAAARVMAEEARRRGIWVSADLDTLDNEEVLAPLLASVDHLVVSEHVAQELSSTPAQTLEALAPRCAPEATVGITLGIRGSLLRLSTGELLETAAYRVEVRDTTGCGDVFRGALLAARLSGAPWSAALEEASAAAALAATALGAQGALATRVDLDALVQRGV